MNVAEWLQRLGLEQYEPAFRENDIGSDLLASLTADDLKDLGITSVGHRRRLLDAVAALRAENAAVGPNTAAPASAPPRDGHEDSPEGDAERRQLTVMFCDLVGSTALSARLDPEDLRKVIGAYHDCVAEVISQFKGFVARYMGDGVLVYFGYPLAHEDDAEQAVRAGLALADAVSRLQTDFDAALQVRIGIATGTVVVGDLIGEGAGQEQAVVGETPNLAARLQALAEPDAVVISASTRRLTGGVFEYRDLGRVALKGLAQPVPAWQVLGTSGVESRFEAQHEASLTPLVGRGEEIELLMRRWRQAAEGDGRVLMLTGEPGIGKSRVVLALQERLQAEPHIRLRYFCSPHHVNSVLFPIISQLERAARFERADTPTRKYDKLEALLAQSATDVKAATALLANLLSLPADDRYPLAALSPQKRKDQTLSTLLTQFETLAGQPVLMLFEDIHWIDPTSLELLALMVERVPRLRMLLIITARPEFTPPWPAHAYVTNVALTRLSRREGTALIEGVTRGKALPEEVRNQILGRTDGVPLFVEELTKTVLESGLLAERDDHYVLERPLPSLAIPTTLHASLMARLDRLASAREVAQIGAAVGREFSYELLSAVAGWSKETLEEALRQLVQSELVFCRGMAPQAVYVFKHVLVRDAAYAGLLKTRRIHLHAAIASAFEQRFPDIVEAEPETLAHHLTEAGLAEKAAGYWLRAGRNAAARYANVEAIAHLRRGIETVDRLPGGPMKDRVDLDLQLALGPCVIVTQGPASSTAATTFARARQLCERLGDPPEYLHVMHWLMVALAVRGELPQAHEASATLLGLAEARGDRPAIINATRAVGAINLMTGRVTEACELAERTVKEFDASNEAEQMAARSAGQDAGAAGLAVMSWALWFLGHVDKAIAQMDAAFQRAEAVKDPHTQSYVCYYASVLYALRREPAAAHRHAERCLILSEEHDFRQWRGLSRAVRGICTAMLDPSSTIDQVIIGLDEYRGAGYQFGITALFILLCEALLLRRQFDTVTEVIEEGFSKCSLNTERLFEAELYRLKARVLLLGKESNASIHLQSLLDKALTVARSQSARSLELRAARDLADFWRDQGRLNEARDLLGPVYAWFTEGLGTPDLKEAKALLEELVN